MRSYATFVKESFTEIEFGLHIKDAKFDSSGNLTGYTAKSVFNDRVISGPVWDRLAGDIAKHLGIKKIAVDFKNDPEDKTILYAEVEETVGGQYFVAVSGKRFIVPKEVERLK